MEGPTPAMENPRILREVCFGSSDRPTVDDSNLQPGASLTPASMVVASEHTCPTRRAHA